MIKKQSFITGAAVLAAASVLCKALSAVFKIPLDTLFLHEEGIALYQSAYSVCNVFLAICITGIPIALSSLIAADRAHANDYRTTAFYAISAAGIIFALLTVIFSKDLALLLSGGEGKNIRLGLCALSPALLFLGFTGSLRGYFQGMENMTPSALGQIAESLAKVFFGLGLCALFIKKGTEYGAAAALFGVSIGQICCAGTLFVMFLKSGGKKGRFNRAMLKRIFCLSLPVTLGAFSYTAALFTDTLTLVPVMAHIGIPPEMRLKSYGLLSRAGTIYNLPATIITAITASAVPMLSALGDKEARSRGVKKVIKSIFLVAAPCGFGMIFFSQNIMSLLYKSRGGADILAFTGLTVLVMPYVQTTSAMLQTFGSVWAPICAGGLCILLKAALNFFLIPALGAGGAALSTAAAFLGAFIFNSILLSKKTPAKGVTPDCIKILLCGAAACALPKLVFKNPGGMTLVFAIFSAAVLYVFFIAASRAIKKEDLKVV